MIHYVIEVSSNRILYSSSDGNIAVNNSESFFEQATFIVQSENEYALDEYVYNPDTSSFVQQLTVDKMRQKRDEIFFGTIDNMNPVWYNALTSDQQTRLAAWRQEWLDYPTTTTEPTTDVTDIFTFRE
jgi:hypothetical protein